MKGIWTMYKELLKLLKNEYIFSICTKLINIVIALLQSILVARYLGPELKGTQTYISSIVSIGSIVVTFGIHQAYPYFRKKYGKDLIMRDYMSIVYILYTAEIVIAFLIACFVLETVELKAAAILIPIFGYSNVVSYVTLVESPNRQNLLSLISELLNILLLAILIFAYRNDAGWAYPNIMWVVIILLFVNLIMAVFFTIKIHCIPHLSYNMRKLAFELLRFGFFPMLALLMTTLNYRIDVIMLRSSRYVSDAQIGVYSIGIALAEKIVLIPDSLKGVLVSKLTKGADPYEVVRACRLSFFASIAICIAFLLFGQWGIVLLYGSEYSDAYSVMMICALGALCIGYFKLIAQYNIVNKKQVRNVVMLSVAIVIDVTFNLILIPLYGIEGAAIATCLGNVVCGIVFVLYFSKLININPTKMFFLQKEDLELVKKLLRRKVKVG